MLQEATNAIPGIRTIISAGAGTEEKSLDKWTGLVTLDYVNHNGGIDRTNLHLRFKAAGDRLYCLEDADFYQQQYLAHLHRIESAQDH